jgi:hypothetical protein
MNSNGNSVNKSFKQHITTHPADLYISASLDLTGLGVGTYYFNNKNNFEYLTTHSNTSLIPIDDSYILSEVLVYTEPPAVLLDPELDVIMNIGGSLGPLTSIPYTQQPVAVPWAGSNGLLPPSPPEWSWSPLSVDDINRGVVNYFGHEGGHFPYYTDLNGDPDPINKYRYLAIDIGIPDLGNVQSSEPSLRNKNRNMLKAKSKARRNRQPRLVGNPVFESGKITVTLKLYPKFQ